MKLKLLLSAAAMGMLMAACQGMGEGPVSLKNATPADSLTYYLGQMQAADYKREAARDTTLNETQNKQAYIQGIRAGLAAMKENSDTYNRGVSEGIRMAMNMEKFAEDYGVTLNKTMFIETMNQYLMSDSVVDTQAIQREFYRLMTQFNEQKEEKDRAAAVESLSQAAQGSPLHKYSDELYGGIVEKTEGQAIAEGDNVELELKVTKQNGESLRTPVGPKVKVGGRNVPGPIDEALKALKSGETGEFMTTAHSLYGQRCAQMGLEPSDIVKFTLKATVAENKEKEEKK